MFHSRFKHQLVQGVLSLPVKGRGRLAYILARLLLGPIKENRVVPTLYGFNIYVNGKSDAHIERSVYYTGTYEKGTLDVLGKLLHKGAVFVDAGANIGLLSIYAAFKVGEEGRVMAFEPYTLVYERLLKNIGINNLGRIETYTVALGATAGEGLLYPNTQFNPGASSMVPTPEGGEAMVIQIQPLEAMIDPNTQVDVLKVDVEGYELDVLKGAETILKRNNAPALIVECSAKRTNSGFDPIDLFNYITSVNQYTVFKIKGGKGTTGPLMPVTTANDLPEHDNLFCLLPHHLNRVYNG